MKKQLLTVTEAAREYMLPQCGLRRMVREGTLPVIQIGTRVYLARNTIEALLRGETAKAYSPEGKYSKREVENEASY